MLIFHNRYVGQAVYARHSYASIGWKILGLLIVVPLRDTKMADNEKLSLGLS